MSQKSQPETFNVYILPQPILVFHTKWKRMRKSTLQIIGCIVFYAIVHTEQHRRSKQKFTFTFTFVWCEWSIRIHMGSWGGGSRGADFEDWFVIVLVNLPQTQEERMDELILFVEHYSKYIVSTIWVRYVLTLSLSHVICWKANNF